AIGRMVALLLRQLNLGCEGQPPQRLKAGQLTEIEAHELPLVELVAWQHELQAGAQAPQLMGSDGVSARCLERERVQLLQGPGHCGLLLRHPQLLYPRLPSSPLVYPRLPSSTLVSPPPSRHAASPQPRL